MHILGIDGKAQHNEAHPQAGEQDMGHADLDPGDNHEYQHGTQQYIALVPVQHFVITDDGDQHHHHHIHHSDVQRVGLGAQGVGTVGGLLIGDGKEQLPQQADRGHGKKDPLVPRLCFAGAPLHIEDQVQVQQRADKGNTDQKNNVPDVVKQVGYLVPVIHGVFRDDRREHMDDAHADHCLIDPGGHGVQPFFQAVQQKGIQEDGKACQRHFDLHIHVHRASSFPENPRACGIFLIVP